MAFRVVLARLLVPEAFGILAAAIAFTNIASLLIDLGFGAALIQRRALTKEDLGTSFWTIFALAFATTSALVILAPGIASFYRQPAVTPVLRALALGILFYAPDAYFSSLLERRLAFRVIALRRFLAVVSAGIVATVTALIGGGVWALVGYSLTQSAVSSVLVAVSAWSVPPLVVSGKSFRSLWSFSRHLFGARAVNYLNRNADNLLIGRFLGADQLGLYSIAYQAVLLPLQYLARPLSSVILPLMSRIQDDSARAGRAWHASVTLLVALTWPFAVLGALASRDGVPLVLGAKWLPAVPVVQILFVVGAVQVITTLSAPIYTALGRPDLSLRWTIVSGVFAVSAFVVGINWGIVGVAIAYGFATVLSTPFNIWWALKLTQSSWSDLLIRISPVVAPVSVVLTAWYACRLIFQTGSNLLSLALACAVISCIDLITVFFVFPDVRRLGREIVSGGR